MNKELELKTLRSILEKERRLIKSEIEKRERFTGELLAIRNNIGILKSSRKLIEGSLIGFVKEGNINELGYVIRRGNLNIIKILQKPPEESEELELLELENLISYDLQIDIIDYFLEEDLPEIRTEFSSRVINGVDKFQGDAAATSLDLEDNQILLVVGPPGTGKTTFISKSAEMATNEGMRVLIASHTNRAVDNAIEKLENGLRVGNPSKVSRNALKYSLEKQVLGNIRIDEDDIEEIVEQFSKKSGKIEREMLRILNSSRIVGSTLIKSAIYPMNEQNFDIVFIDESSQALVSAALLAIQKGRKFVLVGDPYQLSPVLRFSKKPSMFSAFNFFASIKPSMMWLRNHYRSNPKIIGFSEKYIYRSRIRAHPSCNNIKLNIPFESEASFGSGFSSGSENGNPILDPEKPVLYVSVNGTEEGKGSKINRAEAKVAARIVQELEVHGVERDRIGVITPYVKQKELISGLVDVEVNTVDGFQGREKDVIIFSVTAVSDLRFPSDPRRLNVALTRPKKKLIVLGNEKSFMIHANKSKLLYQLFLYARNLGGLVKSA